MTELPSKVLLFIFLVQMTLVYSFRQISSSSIISIAKNNHQQHMECRRTRGVQQPGVEFNGAPIHRRFKSSQDRKTSLHLTPVIEAFSAAFVGGTVGVMGMAFIVETRKLQDESLDMCPYCMGSGEILCGECLGSGLSMDAETGNQVQCSSCQGRKQVLCINCKGDGRNTPIILQSRSARDPDYAVAGKLNEFDLDSP